MKIVGPDDETEIAVAPVIGSEPGEAPAPVSSRRARWPWLLAAAVVAATVGAGWVMWPGFGRQEWLRDAAVRLDPRRRPVPQEEGPLDGLVVYLSAGHGWLLHRQHHDGEPIQWGLQRDEHHGVTEDLYTARFVADELAPALQEAGATVIALRERDRNEQMVVVDDLSPSFAAVGSAGWVASELAHDQGAMQLKPGGWASWSLQVPHDGRWLLYGRWLEDSAHDAQAVYTVVAGDVVEEVVVDQRYHGGHWWPLLDACLPGGTRVDVTLTGSGPAPLSADAVRLGGGTFIGAPPTDYRVRQHPMWEMSFQESVEHLGGPERLRVYACGNPVSDMRIRPHWASWASPVGEEALYLSIHTNGGGGEGLLVFSGIDGNPPTPAHPGSDALAAAVERSVLSAVSRVDPTYRSKGWKPGDFSEISPVHNTLPAVLVELAFHDHPRDAARLRNPAVQRAAAEGLVEGIRRWRAAGGRLARAGMYEEDTPQ
jgi:hypothetical protein